MHGGSALTAITLAMVLSAGCDQVEPPARPAKAKPAFSPPEDEIGARLALVAAEVAPDHVLDAAVFRDRLVLGATRDFLAVLVAEHCYRILGVGGPRVEDLDLVLYDPNGVQVRRDLDESPRAELGTDAELCPPQPGAYRLQARMTAGEGEVLVGVYRTLQ